jgi:hypothetical protein
MNAFKCYQEISQLDRLASVFTLDNSKLDKFVINKQFANLFNIAIDIPNHTNLKGNIDKAEMWEILTTRGNSIITTVSTNNSSNISSLIIKSWEQNIFSDIEKDKKIVYMGLSLLDDVNIDDLKKYTGNPFDVFKNYNRDTNVTILSGLSFPETRINQIADFLNENKENIISNLSNSQTAKLSKSLDWINSISNNKIDNLSNIDDILQKYS